MKKQSIIGFALVLSLAMAIFLVPNKASANIFTDFIKFVTGRDNTEKSLGKSGVQKAAISNVTQKSTATVTGNKGVVRVEYVSYGFTFENLGDVTLYMSKNI